jgi:predicted Zn-dependent peptidase
MTRAKTALAALTAGLMLLLSSEVQAQALEGRVREVTLDNGMRFLLVRRGTAPVFSAILRFRVGSADDRSGRTGLAHLFEHLAFKGTSRIGARDAEKERQVLDDLDATVRELQAELDKGEAADEKKLEALRARMKELTRREGELVVKDEFSDILTTNGAVGLNASTTTDLTSYYVSLPTNRLELWCLMESARLRDPVLREFYSERDVVMEERRFRYDNHPSGRLYEQLLLTAFAAHPYRGPGIGWMSDLERVTRPDAEAFRRVYYVPNNAVGAIVGAIDEKAAEALLRKYFGRLPRGAEPPVVSTVEPAQAGEKRLRVEFEAEPLIMIAYHKPGLMHADDPVLEILDGVLSAGRTGRLYRTLVTEKQLASDVFTFEAPGQRWPNLYVIGAVPLAPHTTEEIEAALFEELRRLAVAPVSEAEIRKIKAQTESDAVYDLRSNTGLADQLSRFEILTGDWRNLPRHTKALMAVTPAMVQDVARRIFTESNRTVAVLQRPAAEGDPDAAAPRSAHPQAAEPQARQPGF